MIVVGVGAVALIAVTGLAIDGGMAAGAYRHAQNAADAGALAAARQEFLDAMSSPPVASTTSSLTPVATKEVNHNGAQFSNLTSGGLSGTYGASTSSTLWVPSTTGGMSAQADFAELSANVPVYNPGGLITANPSYSLDVLSNKAYGQIQMAPTVAPSTGSQASSLAETMSFNSGITTVGESGPHTTTVSGDQNCLTSSAQYSTVPDGSPTSCSNNSVISSLPSPLNTALADTYTLAGSPNPDAHVSSGNAPHSYPSINQGSNSTSISALATAGAASVTVTTGVSASQVHSDDVVGWDTLTGATIANANTSASNVSVSSALVNVSATNLSMSLTASMGPTDTHPVITPSCSTATLTFSAGARLVVDGFASGSASGTATVNADCTISTPPSIPDVTMTGPWYSPSSDYSTACNYNSDTGTWSCSVQSCLLRIAVTDPATNVSATICLLQTVLGFGVTSVTIPYTNTASAVLPDYIGAVAVTAHVPQNTYFMRAVGWNQTDPSATAIAAVANVVDESPSAFAASPFGMPNSATVMGGAPGQTQCAFQFSALLTGCYYYLNGTSMYTYNPSALGPSWLGPLDPTTSGHKVGDAVKASSSSPTLQTYQGTSYYLEPVFDASSLKVLYYAVFLPVPGHSNWGELVNSVPSLGGPIVTANTGAGWAVQLTPGAVSIKVVS